MGGSLHRGRWYSGRRVDTRGTQCGNSTHMRSKWVATTVQSTGRSWRTRARRIAPTQVANLPSLPTAHRPVPPAPPSLACRPRPRERLLCSLSPAAPCPMGNPAGPRASPHQAPPREGRPRGRRRRRSRTPPASPGLRP
eukprot:scaffold30032_cov138-Isochrysis_galbana.AAC.12